MPKGFRSIHHRLFLLFLFCMSGIVLIVSLLYYSRATEDYHEKLSDLSQKNVAQTAGLFRLLYQGYDSLSKSLINNFEMIRLLNENSGEPAVEYINEQSITNILGAIFYSRDDLVGIHIISDKGKIYNYGNVMNVVDPDYRNSEWYKQVKASRGKMVWLGIFEHSLIDKVEDQPVFAFGRQIYDLNEHKPIGIALYEMNPAPIMNALENLKLSENSKVYLLSGDGSMVSPGEELPAEIGSLPLLQNPGQVKVERFGGKLIIASQLPLSGWSVVSVTPAQDLNVELAQTKRFLLIVISILIVVSALIASIVSRTISSPLKRLIRQMKQVETGNFRGTLEVASYQEIHILVASFNRMVRTIEELIEQVKVSSVSEKNAELQALQSQVNPHFLYNTLDMIYWMLDEKEQDQLGELVLSLSSMFRYSSIWSEGAEVTLREELEQTRHYLKIISIRLEGRLTVICDVDEQWLDVHLPKMTVQPVIENAVKHGLERAGRPGVLRLSSLLEGSALKIIIEDNGVGMDHERHQQLKDSLAQADQSGNGETGIGLINLHRRLQHMFGRAGGLQIESEQHAGTRVAIILPLKGRDEYHANSDSG
ncbi:sensor histidine kinase [Paenibacillus brevis]|uniref:Sensor histidine kinase n=1 Tax=Paenibacillus brevis TaxID=2841508 RepID=A0ABS6FQS6_9BACL|nr:sensor histidine kinase [Paenibacillus brevis]MBU5671822.1 sensor histidine kinase [Paenibacillus brevis]